MMVTSLQAADIREREKSLRHSGIDIIGDVPWGSHFCQFYRTAEDLLDILVPYFEAGLENDEFCMWVTSQPVDVAAATEALRRVVPDVDQYLARGQLEILTHDQWYVIEGVFEAERVLNGWVARHDWALARGFAGLRLTGNTFWLERPDWRSFTDYERTVDEVIGQYQMLALCTYQVDRCGVSEVADVISNHQFALVKRHGRWEIIESGERKRAEAERERLLVEAQRHAEIAERRAAELDIANRELEAFTSSVSHDLRGPVRGIDGLSQILLEAYADRLDDRGKEYLRLVQAASQKMMQLIDGLLDLSRTSRVEMHRQHVDLSRLAETIAADLRRAQPGRDVDFAIAPGLTVEGDPSLLRAMLENLLGNAWKFTAKHATAKIELGVGEQDAERVFFVRDDGAGFDMAFAGQLFAPFQRLHREQEFPGEGIGLATVQRVVQRHGGRVWAEGAVEQGATVYFTLPG